MLRLLKLFVSVGFLAAFVWFGMAVPLGERTLFAHVRAIANSKESEELVKGTKEKVGGLFGDEEADGQGAPGRIEGDSAKRAGKAPAHAATKPSNPPIRFVDPPAERPEKPARAKGATGKEASPPAAKGAPRPGDKGADRATGAAAAKAAPEGSQEALAGADRQGRRKPPETRRPDGQP